ncbi:MAG: hypothetical protein HY808_06830 [Nitrospirae bacterium]|nr:hypothetical protein [Nitrospirota bacterium]
MKTARIISLIIVIISSVVICCSTALADTENYKEEITLAVGESSLTQEQKTSLINSSHNAMKTGIPPDDVAIIIRRGLSGGWDGKSLEALMTAVVSAKEQNLPVRSVLDRIEQGLSKRVSSEKVLYATTGLIEKTAAADRIVNSLVGSGMKTDKDTDTGETAQTVAKAMEKSVPEDTIMQTGQKVMKNNQSLSRFNVAMATMTAFIEMGMPPEHAQKFIGKAIDKGYTEDDMIMMDRSFFNGIKSGSDMNHMMQNMDSMMNSGGMGFHGMSGGAGMRSGSGMGGQGTGGGGMGGGSGMGGQSGGEGGKHGM